MTLKRIFKDFELFAFSVLGSVLFDFFLFNWIRKFFYCRITHGKFKRLGHKVTIRSEHIGYRGKVKFGKNILLNNNVTLDITGNLSVGNHVIISDNVIVYTHSHDYENAESNDWKHPVCPTFLVIEEGAWIGANALILPSVKKIGRGAVVGAGSVVTKDVDDYTVVAGNPAKLLRTYK